MPLITDPDIYYSQPVNKPDLMIPGLGQQMIILARWSRRGFVIGCAVPLLFLVLSGVNDHNAQIGAVDPGQLPLGLAVHEVYVDRTGERGGKTSLGHHHLPDSLHEDQAVFHHRLFSHHFVSWVPGQVVLQGLAHNISERRFSRWWYFVH